MPKSICHDKLNINIVVILVRDKTSSCLEGGWMVTTFFSPRAHKVAITIRRISFIIHIF
jgi:hypothetical protein